MNISTILRNGLIPKELDFQTIFLSEAVTNEYFGDRAGQHFDALDADEVSTDRIDIPFDSIYVESVSDDLYFGIFDKSKKQHRVVSILITKNNQGEYVCVQFLNGFDPIIRLLASFDKRLFEILNDKKNGFAFCNYNKLERHTGNRLIKDIVYCDRVKSLKVNKVKIDSKPFKYSHLFDVRGHWRAIKSIGKNPGGEYVVSGATWVRPCKKGIGEYHKKTRVFN